MKILGIEIRATAVERKCGQPVVGKQLQIRNYNEHST